MNKGKVYLRGGNFINRYRIDGILTTRSPIHIGSGGDTKRTGCIKPSQDGEPAEQVAISAVITDFQQKPYLPGSSIRGNLRHWLLQLFKSSVGSRNTHEIAYANEGKELDEQVEKWAKKKKMTSYSDQDKEIAFVKKEASLLERLFGTNLAATKVDFWDAYHIPASVPIQSSALPPEDQAPFWSSQRLTYVSQSVAIDPNTQTAMDKRLYHFELVPKGIKFGITISGKNLTSEELGLLLFALEGFNSSIFPVTLGSMIGRGFGQLDFELGDIYCLLSEDRDNWVKAVLNDDRAGFENLKKLPYDKKIQTIMDSKYAFLKLTGVGA